MRKMKNERGVTLIILVITVIVLLILTSVNINNARNQIGLKEVNNLYTDIDVISAKLTEYYLKENKLPVTDEYLINKNELNTYLRNRGILSGDLNINDGDNYYVIDLSQLENLSLNYGKDYKKWPSTKLQENVNDDVYIINEKTHQIYYPSGIQNATKFVITNTINKDQIKKSEIESTINSSQVSANIDSFNWIQDSNVKILSQENNETKVLINTKINFDYFFQIYKEKSLEFQYSYESDEANLDNNKFVKFSLDENDSAILTSNTITVQSNKKTIYLWIKVQDIYGNIIVQKGDNISLDTSKQIWEQNGVWVTDNTGKKLEVGSQVTGYSVTVSGTTYGDGKWYVLGAQNGKLLITTNENVSSITLSGKNGYTGGISTLNTEAAKYTNSNYAEGQARSINVYDINKVTGYNPAVAKWNSGNNVNQWGNRLTYTKNASDSKIYYYATKYPTEETSTSYESFTYWTGAEWKTLANDESSPKIMYTRYIYYPQTCSATSSSETSINESESAYNLLFKDTTGTNKNYWLASIDVNATNGVCYFEMRRIYNGSVHTHGICSSDRYFLESKFWYKTSSYLKTFC